MTAYYNDNEPFVVEWLKNLVREGLIAPGDVDDRPIQEVQPEDLNGYTQCHFFAGIGGWNYALRLAGWPDDRPVWTGSCPCQPFSTAGKRRSHQDARHLWPPWYNLIVQCYPPTVFGEQVSNAAGFGWIDAVAGDLESQDYGFGACVLGSDIVGSPHQRKRVYFVAHAEREGLEGYWRSHEASGINGASPSDAPTDVRQTFWQSDANWHLALAHGLPDRVGRLRAYGNAIVPQVAAAFIQAYQGTLT